MAYERVSDGVESTRRAGEQFAGLLHCGDLVLLTGPLGAGKTAFAQGIGRGLGVEGKVTSPTFTVVRQHRAHNAAGVATMHHADVYRLDSADEIYDLALGELLEEDAVAVIEWGERAEAILGGEPLVVAIEVDGEDRRRIRVTGAGVTGREAALERWATS